MPKPSSTTITTDATTDTLGSASLLDQIMAETKLVPAQEGYQVARQGVSAFIAEILKSNDPDQLINKHRADQMIAEIDRVLGKQMDAILHQPEFQQLESSWRSLKLLVDRTDFRENIKLEILHASKEDLLDDFENAADITCSGIYKHVYTAGYGQFGGEPVAAMVGNYNFGPSSPDIKLLSYMASVGAMSHAPFLAAPAPEFFNLSCFEELPNLKEIKDLFAGPRHAKWRAFRESEDARHVAWPGLASCFVPLTTRRNNRSRASTTTKTSPGSTTTTCGAILRFCWPAASMTASPATAGVRTSSAHNRAAPSKTCRFTCMKPSASCRPRFLPRC